MSDDLSPVQRAKIRRLAAPFAVDATDSGELNVVPYLDIIMNVMMFVLVTVSVVFASTIPTAAAAPSRPSEKTALHLAVLVTGDGVAFKTGQGAIAPGCASVGGGTTVAMTDGFYDLAGVTSCARALKREAGKSGLDETQVTVTASPNVPYEVVVGVMDALRSDGEGALFPDVTLGAVR